MYIYKPFGFFVENKRVALVGPAAYLENKNRGSTIDSYDLVARINWCWPLPNNLHKHLGSKTDILGHCCHPHLNPRNLPFEEIKYLIFLDVSENERLGFFRNPNQYILINEAKKAGLPYHTYGQNCPIYQEIIFEGIAGIAQYLLCLLLHHKVKEIYLTGFAPMSGYQSHYPMDPPTVPDKFYKDHFTWFINQRDYRIVMDEDMNQWSRQV